MDFFFNTIQKNIFSNHYHFTLYWTELFFSIFSFNPCQFLFLFNLNQGQNCNISCIWTDKLHLLQLFQFFLNFVILKYINLYLFAFQGLRYKITSEFSGVSNTLKAGLHRLLLSVDLSVWFSEDFNRVGRSSRNSSKWDRSWGQYNLLL